MQNNNNEVSQSQSLMKESHKERAFSVLPLDKNKLNENDESKQQKSDETRSNGIFDQVRASSPEVKAKEINDLRCDTDSPELLNINKAINKDEVLESLAKIFNETQMLANDSPITKELVAIENSASKINQDLKACLMALNPSSEDSRVDSRSSQEILTEAMGDVCNLRFCLENLINTFEGIREKLYPPVEKVVLIQLEKNHYQISGTPFKRTILLDSKVINSIKCIYF